MSASSYVCVNFLEQKLCVVSHSDKMFPAFGFGAKIPPTMQVIVCVN